MSELYPHKGRLRISRYTSNVEPREGISIRITDDASGVTFFSGEMSIEALGYVLTASEVAIDFKVFGTKSIGMKSENKTEIVPGDWFDFKNSAEKTRAALAPFEVDGWKGRVYDLHNHHNQGKDGVCVAFFRHVHPETGLPVEAERGREAEC